MKNENRIIGKVSYRRKLKAKKIKMPPEMRERILGSVRKVGTHWHLDEEDWSLPAPDQGSRRIVFEAHLGAISSTSEIYRTCSDPKCVSPYHVEIENITMRKNRLAGLIPRLVVIGVSKPITVEQFEKELRDPAMFRHWTENQKEGKPINPEIDPKLITPTLQNR